MVTYDDATLMVQLLQLGTQMGLQESMLAIRADDFDPETATTNNHDVQTVLNFGEVVATLVKQNVLSRELVTDMLALHLAWKRVGAAAVRERERVGEPRMYENFEALVKGATAAASR
jgi:hypothetical protein